MSQEKKVALCDQSHKGGAAHPFRVAQRELTKIKGAMPNAQCRILLGITSKKYYLCTLDTNNYKSFFVASYETLELLISALIILPQFLDSKELKKCTEPQNKIAVSWVLVLADLLLPVDFSNYERLHDF